MQIWWDAEKPYIMRVHISVPGTWKAYDAMVDDMRRQIRARTDDIYLLITRDGSTHYNGAVQHIQSAIEFCAQQPHIQVIVNVFPAPDTFPEIVIQTILRLHVPDEKHRWHIVRSLDAGYCFIAQHRQRLTSDQ